MKHESHIATFSIVFVVISAFCSCDKTVDRKPGQLPPDNHEKVTITQGAWGNVWWWEGDFMPTTDPGGPGGRITPVVRTVYVYELTTVQQVDQVEYSPFYRAIHSDLVDSVQSDITGFFQCSLDSGRYSFFIREDSLYYANGFDGVGNILPVTVKPDSLTRVQIDISYKATY